MKRCSKPRSQSSLPQPEGVRFSFQYAKEYVIDECVLGADVSTLTTPLFLRQGKNLRTLQYNYYNNNIP